MRRFLEAAGLGASMSAAVMLATLGHIPELGFPLLVLIMIGTAAGLTRPTTRR